MDDAARLSIDPGLIEEAKRTRKPPPVEDASRHIGCPLWWFKAVYPIARGKSDLAVALFLYRQRAIQGSRCACRKSNPDILVMQSAEDWAAKNRSCPLNRAR